MIYIYSGGKFKVKKYKTSDELIKGLTIENKDKQKCEDGQNWNGFTIEKREQFDKRIERGLDVYCYTNYYEPGLFDFDTIYWNVNPEDAEESYSKMVEEV